MYKLQVIPFGVGAKNRPVTRTVPVEAESIDHVAVCSGFPCMVGNVIQRGMLVRHGKFDGGGSLRAPLI